jgi:26S proteasome regulatory subunit T1
VAPTDIEESMRVGVDRIKYAIQIPLPPRIDPSVSLMVRTGSCVESKSGLERITLLLQTVEDKPDVTYDEVGGAKDALEKLREVK